MSFRPDHLQGDIDLATGTPPDSQIIFCSQSDLFIGNNSTLSVPMSVCLCLSIYVSVSVCPCLYVCLSIYLLPNVEETGRELGKGAYGVVVEMKLPNGTRVVGKKIHDLLLGEGSIIPSQFEHECLM